MGKPASANRSRRIFYGWYIVAGAVVASTASSGLTSVAPPVLLKPMSAELGWSRTDFYTVQALATVVAGLAAPFVGRRIDRGNPRWLILAGSLVVGGSVMAYSQVHSLWLYLLLAGIIAPLGMALGGMAVFNALVAKWFVRKRGRALVTAGLGPPLSGMIIPSSAVALTAAFGWRMTWAVFGAAFVVLMASAAFLAKRSPEDVGLRPDGDPQPHSTEPVSPLRQEPEWGWRQLMRSGTFWMIALLFGIVMIPSNGAYLHQYPFFSDRGIAPVIAAPMVSTISITAFALRPLWAYIFEKWDLRHVALLAFSTFAVSTGGMLLTTNIPALFLLMVIRGVAYGGYGQLSTMFFAHHFGRRSLGEVLGLAHLVALPFSAAGPLLAARMFDLLHSYTLIFAIFTIMFVLCSIAVFRIRSPKAARALTPAR